MIFDTKGILKRFKEMDDKGAKTYFDADEVMALLDHFEYKEDYDNFEKALELGLTLHPEYEEWPTAVAKMLMFREHFEEALDFILQTAGNDEGLLQLLKIECHCRLYQYNEVIRILEENRAQNVEDVEDLYEFTACLLSEWENREKDLDEFVAYGLTVYPDNPVLKEEYCYQLESKGYIKKAIAVCNDLIDSDPHFADFWYMAGRLYAEMNEFDKAVEALDYAMTCDDSDVEIKLFRAYCLYKNDLFTKAVDEFGEIFAHESGVEEEEDIRKIIEEIATDYPVPNDFRDVCYLFEVLRDENKPGSVISLSELPFPNESDAPEQKTATITRQSDTSTNPTKHAIPNETEQYEDLHFLRSKELHRDESRGISSKQLSKSFIKEKYNRN